MELTMEYWACGSVQNGCLLQADQEGKFDAEADLVSFKRIEMVFKEIWCGTKHCLGLKGQQLYIWGEHICKQGQTKESIQPIPIAIEINVAVLKVSCGFEHTLIMSQTGQVFGFGKNNHGQLGLSRTTKSLSDPFLIQHDAFLIKAGPRSSFIISQNKSLVVFGYNKDRQLGVDAQYIETPTQVLNLKVADVDCGFKHTVIRLTNGDLFGCGSNQRGQLGVQTTPVFKQLEVCQGIRACCSWFNTVFYRIGDCEIRVIGDNKYKQTGDNGTIKFEGGLVQIACMSESFACLVKVGEELKLFTWGWNEHGNLGLGDREDRSTPSPVNLKIGVGSKIFAGGAFLFATN